MVVPGVITDLYTDMRVLLGWAWTYLIVAELIGVSSGITYFINQQAKYRAYEHVFASIILIGLIGLGHRHRARVAGPAALPVAADGAARAGSRRSLGMLRGRARAGARRAGAARGQRRGAPKEVGARMTGARRAELPRAGARGRARASPS